MYTGNIEYTHDDDLFEAYVAYDDSTMEKRPAVLIFHDWSGRNDFACAKAEQLAELGFVGIALDLYGKGKLGQDNVEKAALMQPYIDNRNFLQQRMLAGLEMAKSVAQVDQEQIAAIGFCFGGLCALDLARSGADIKAVVSFHGLLFAPASVAKQKIKAKVLVLHGYADPMVSPENVNEFAKEMTEQDVDWQIHMYGNTMHAFTNPNANDPDFGTVYAADADRRSWIAMQNFLNEVFG